MKRRAKTNHALKTYSSNAMSMRNRWKLQVHNHLRFSLIQALVGQWAQRWRQIVLELPWVKIL